MSINSFRINRMSGDSKSIWLVSKWVMFAREDMKRRYNLPQYCIEINN